MESIRQRAVSMLPSVMLTALSMVQAIAIELLWSRLWESPYLWVWGWEAVVGWSQSVTCFVGFLLMWVLYVTMVVQFRWVPSIRDIIIPFLVGVLEFGLIAATAPSLLGIWFGILGLLFLVSFWTSQTTAMRARRDPRNREFFDGTEPATWRDLVWPAVPPGALFALSLFFFLTGSKGAFALMAVLIALGFILNRMWILSRWWNHAISETSEPEMVADQASAPS
ncbi:MAG: hypothetical protein VCC04_13350 [Myxococcota bacterium]